MSLIIGLTTPEAVILAADSRQTYRNEAGAVRTGSDSATKIYPLTRYVGVAFAGAAFLNDPKDQTPRSMGSFVQEFSQTRIKKGDNIKQIVDNIKLYIEELYNPTARIKEAEQKASEHIEQQLRGRIIKRTKREDHVVIDFLTADGKPAQAVAGVTKINLLVAGYDIPKNDRPQLNLYAIDIPGKVTHFRKSDSPGRFGATWSGQGEVMRRIIKGFDQSEFGQLEAIKSLAGSEAEKKLQNDLNKLEYRINWGTMNTYDAVNFATLMIETTAAIQKFSDGTALQPGGIPGVGGSTDIAVIDPQDGFAWHRKKKLDLEKVYP